MLALGRGAAEFRLELVNSQFLDGCAIGASLRGREKNKDSRVRTPGRQRYGASLLVVACFFQVIVLTYYRCTNIYVHIATSWVLEFTVFSFVIANLWRGFQLKDF